MAMMPMAANRRCGSGFVNFVPCLTDKQWRETRALSRMLDLMIRRGFAATASATVHSPVVTALPAEVKHPAKASRFDNEDWLIILGTIGDEP